MEKSIVFDASDYPKIMSGAEQLPLVVSLTITNIRLYHVRIDGGAILNLKSLVAFQKLQISMSRVSPLRPLLGVGMGSIIPRGSIFLPVTFGMPENYRTESILFNVAEVNPVPVHCCRPLWIHGLEDGIAQWHHQDPYQFIGRPAPYQFIAIIHYGYLVLKMPSPNDIIKICGECSAGVPALEKLQVLAVTHEVAASQGVLDQAPSSLHQHVSSSAPHVQPSDSEDVPMKVIQISTDAAQTNRIAENLGDK
jgi:hypothetical protein